MMLAPLLFFAGQGAAATTPHDRTVELEIGEEHPALIEGKGPTVALEHEVAFEGTLHVWARSERDLFLQVEDAEEWRTLASDDDSGGAGTPYLALEVRGGERLLVLVAGEPGVTGKLSLHLAAAPETAVTRAAAASGQRSLDAAARLASRGARAEARERIHGAITELLQTPGAAHSEAVATTLYDQAVLAKGELGDNEASERAWSLALAHAERTLPADHPWLLRVRGNLAIVRGATGDLSAARVLEEAVLAASERTLPADHVDLIRARGNLASTMYKQGDLAGARALQEQALVECERAFPEGHPDLLRARANLSVTMYEEGDLIGARRLQEAVLAARERALPEDHPDLLWLRASLAATLFTQGDLAGARALEEAVLAARERTLPEGHGDLLRARLNLATTMHEQGDLAGARALQEAVLAAKQGALPADHPDLLTARHNLATTLYLQGDLKGARALHEEALGGLARTLPADHPDLLLARENLALTLRAEGDLAGARALQEVVLAYREEALPGDHPDLLRARAKLAVTVFEEGDHAAARALIPELVAGMRERVVRSLALAPRQVGEAVAIEAPRLATALRVTRSANSELQRSVFALQETMRLVTGEAARALRGARDPAVRALLGEAAAVRTALNDLVARSTEEHDTGALAAELTRLLQERDRLEREASQRLAEQGVTTRPVTPARLVEALGDDAALVTFRRIAYVPGNEASGKEGAPREHLLAHVLADDGSLVRLDLGAAGELEELVAGWRGALGAPLLRGVQADPDAGGKESPEREAGEALRARLLDPILAVLDRDTRRLYVCADDLVFLVPLDALPLEGGRVGDRWTIANEVSCARLQVPFAPLDVEPELLVLGGVDYDGDGGTEEGVGSSRGSRPERFWPLLQARFEAETTGALFEELFGVRPIVLTRDEATRQALFEHAPDRRFVHLATHGWFAPETIRSRLDPEPAGRGLTWARTGLQERVTGMAPMLLCGLALAGANRPLDSLGRRPGVLTAEELCSLDLSSCELAVLSACETNVGIRRAGQGIQSLQSALYAAGARSSITSLWKVDDAATRRLFEIFYAKLWGERLPKVKALWEAKCVLRDEGAPVRDWAGWVLTGDSG